MPTVKALDLGRHLQGAAVAPVYALVGDDDGLLTSSLSGLELFAAPPDQPGSTVRRFEGAPEPRDVFDELRTVPFLGMTGRRVAVVEDAGPFLQQHADRVVAYLQSPTPTGTLIMCLQKLDGRSRVAKALRERGVIVDCSRIRWRDAEAWVRGRARQAGKPITPQAAAQLVDAVGPDLLALGNELDKLVAYCGEEDAVTEDALTHVTAHGRARSVFDLGEAMSRRDAAQALRLARGLLERGEPVEFLIAMLARRVRRLWQVARLKADGASPGEIQKRTGVPEFAVRRDLDIVARLTDAWFVARLRTLAGADYELKTTSLRSTEQDVWVENLVVRLCGE
jgi:DNA polymerase-3 subunit delta